jgi:hypothetical protein
VTEVAGPRTRAARILCGVKAILAVVLAALVAACSRPPPAAPSSPGPPAAASAPAVPLRREPALACPTATPVAGIERRPACAQREPACVEACRVGDPESCYWLAVAVQADPATEADATALFHRACELGHASGCTNYGAWLWSEGTDLACAGRLFERACAVDDSHGCGMIGRLALERTPPPDDAERARIRAHLEQSCARVGAFPCRVLAAALESGDLGPTVPLEIRRLLTRACDTGDPAACGEPPTAVGTFGD